MATNSSLTYRSLTLYSQARKRAKRLRSLYIPVEEENAIFEQSRREIDALLGSTPATPSQRNTLGWLRVELFKKQGMGNTDDYEYKKFEIGSICRKLYLIAEIGRIRDEGTAAMINRDHRMIAVGPRGGLELLTARRKGKVIGRAVLYARSW